MRLKYYLRGLGLGIIFTVIIMNIGNHNSNQTATSDASEYQNSTQSKAESLFESDTETKSQKVSDSSKPDNNKNTEEMTNVISTDSTSDNTSVDELTEDVSSNNTHPQENTTFTITVLPSDTCRTISERLQAAGIIDDSEKFRIYVGEKGVDHLIADGDHEIPYGSSYDDIINILIQN